MEVRGFLGSVNYIRIFYKEISQVVTTLNYITVEVEFLWGDSQQNAFNKVKELIGLAPVLTHPNSEEMLILENNDLNYAMGTVLLQISQDDAEHHVSFLRKKCSYLRQSTLS